MTERNFNLVERVYADIRRKLQLSQVSHDMRLVDTEIAATYGTSRMPVREALLRLVAEGYLVGSARGFVLPRLSQDDVVELFELRRQLEPRAAAGAARDLTASAANGLGEAMVRIREGHASGQIDMIVRANLDFRNGWVSCVSNRRMAATISRFMDYFHAIRLETFSDWTTRRAYVEGLEALFSAFAARDPLAAGDRMTAFLFTAERAYLAALATIGSLSAPAATRSSKNRQKP